MFRIVPSVSFAEQNRRKAPEKRANFRPDDRKFDDQLKAEIWSVEGRVRPAPGIFPFLGQAALQLTDGQAFQIRLGSGGGTENRNLYPRGRVDGGHLDLLADRPEFKIDFAGLRVATHPGSPN
jgi:hypothetical protein